MDPAFQHYNDFAQWARHQRERFHDQVDDHGHPAAHMIRQHLQDLEDAAQSKRNPRDLEQRMRVIQRQIKQAENDGARMMDLSHSRDMHYNLEHKITEIRNWPHYR